jgi:hypothetical protein
MASQALVNKLYSEDPERGTTNAYIDAMPQVELPKAGLVPSDGGPEMLLTFKGFPVAIARTDDLGSGEGTGWFQVMLRLPLNVEVDYHREKATVFLRFPKGDWQVPQGE